jgi:hypothetical protein
VAPGRCFGTNGHRDMDIISYVLDDTLTHADSMGNGSALRYGDVQRMSAGTGVSHSEFNHSSDERSRVSLRATKRDTLMLLRRRATPTDRVSGWPRRLRYRQLRRLFVFPRRLVTLRTRHRALRTRPNTTASRLKRIFAFLVIWVAVASDTCRVDRLCPFFQFKIVARCDVVVLLRALYDVTQHPFVRSISWLAPSVAFAPRLIPLG